MPGRLAKQAAARGSLCLLPSWHQPELRPRERGLALLSLAKLAGGTSGTSAPE